MFLLKFTKPLGRNTILRMQILLTILEQENINSGIMILIIITSHSSRQTLSILLNKVLELQNITAARTIIDNLNFAIILAEHITELKSNHLTENILSVYLLHCLHNGNV